MFVTTDWIIQKCVCVDVAKQIFDTLYQFAGRACGHS